MPRTRNRLKAAMDLLHKSNPKAIRRADIASLPTRYFPTGSFDLDHRLGGGLRVGGVTMFWGEKSGGKTSSAARICGIAQGFCRNCYRKAHRDAWVVMEGLISEPTEEDLRDQVRDAIKQTESHRTRVEAHEHVVDLGYEMTGKGSSSFVVYEKEDGGVKVYALVSRIAGDVESVPNPDDPDERWNAKGWCDCHSTPNPNPEFEGSPLYDPEAPDRDQLMVWGYLDKKVPLNSKAHREALDAWRLSLTLNSYDEVIVNWVDMEGTLDLEWIAKLGVDVKRLYITLPDSAEECIDLCATMLATMDVDLQVIDSIATLTPTKELEESASDWQQGLMARLMNKAVRRWNQHMLHAKRHELKPLTQIWINQERVKIGVMFGSPATMPGGLGQGFQVINEVKWRHGKTETTSEQYGAKNEAIEMAVWEELQFEITKSKSGGMRKTRGNYRMACRDTATYPAGTVLDHERITKLALARLVKQDKKGSKKIYKLGDREYTSQSAIGNDLMEDKELYEMVRGVLLELELESAAA
jgi:RecA/RadA recombinase